MRGNIAVLPGDGIGKEITSGAVEILEAVAINLIMNLNLSMAKLVEMPLMLIGYTTTR